MQVAIRKSAHEGGWRDYMKTLTVFAVCEQRIFDTIDGVACLNPVFAEFDFIVS